MNQQPPDRRFSQLYVDRGKALFDSPRFRVRLAAYFNEHLRKIVGTGVSAAIKRELGVGTEFVGYPSEWMRFFEKCEDRDLLDVITLVWKEARKTRYATNYIGWLEFVRRAMFEENMGYIVDDECVVHFAVDLEFSRSKVATVQRLGDARYGAVRHAFENVGKALDQAEPDTLKAVRAIYDAQETLFKLMFPTTSRLGPSEIRQYFQPRLPDLQPNGAALEATKQLLNAWINWVVALQQYRHAEGIETANPPPVEVAVALVSIGTDFLRWLLEIDSYIGSPTGKSAA